MFNAVFLLNGLFLVWQQAARPPLGIDGAQGECSTTRCRIFIASSTFANLIAVPTWDEFPAYTTHIWQNTLVPRIRLFLLRPQPSPLSHHYDPLTKVCVGVYF